MPYRTSKALAVLSLLTVGCFGTSTGNPNGGGGPDDPGPTTGGPGVGEEGTLGGHCRKAGTREVSEDEQTSLGLSARDVLNNALGQKNETLRWQPTRMGSYGPEQGEQALSLRIERASAPIRLVD